LGQLIVRYLIDTNILIHPLDARDPIKQQRAIQTLLQLDGRGDAALAAQVLAEYANVALKKFGLPASNIYQHVQGYETSFTVYPLTPAVVLEAVRGVRDHHLTYYDAQIWAVAKLNQVPLILTEDFNSGGTLLVPNAAPYGLSTLEGVHFLNPFDAGFNPASL
jgi:predicted nucleic acid-binding protein